MPENNNIKGKISNYLKTKPGDNEYKDAEEIISELSIGPILDKSFTEDLILKLEADKEPEGIEKCKRILYWLKDEKIVVYPNKNDLEVLRNRLDSLPEEEQLHPVFSVNRSEDPNSILIKIVSKNDYKHEKSPENKKNAISLIVQCMFVVFCNEQEIYYTLHDRSYSGAEDATSKYALVSGRVSLLDLNGQESLGAKKLFENALARELREIDELNLPGSEVNEYMKRAVYIGAFTNQEQQKKENANKKKDENVLLSCLFAIGITPGEYNRLNERGPYLIPIKSEEYSKLRVLNLVGEILTVNSCSKCNSFYKEKTDVDIPHCIIKKIDRMKREIFAKLPRQVEKETEEDEYYIDTPFYKNRIRFRSNSTIIAVDISNYSLLEKHIMLEIRDQLQRFLFSFFPIPQTEEASGYYSHIQTTGDGYNIVLSNKKPHDKTVFKLTEESFAKLKEEQIPPNIITRLEELENHEFASQTKFLEAIGRLKNADEINQYRLDILKYAQPFYKKPYLAIIAYFFAIYLNLKIKNLKKWSENLEPTAVAPYAQLDIRIGLHSDDVEKRISLDQTYFPGDGIINATRLLDFAREGQILGSQNFSLQFLTEIEDVYSEEFNKSFDAMAINSETVDWAENTIAIKFICFYKSYIKGPKEIAKIDIWQKDKFIKLLQRLELPPDIVQLMFSDNSDIPGCFAKNGFTISDFGFLTDKHGIRHRVFNLGIFFKEDKHIPDFGNRPIAKIPIILRNPKTTADEMNNLLGSFKYADHLSIYGYSNIRLLKEIYRLLARDKNYFRSLTELNIIFYSFDQIHHINEPRSIILARLWWIMGFLYAHRIIGTLKSDLGKKFEGKVKINNIRYGFNILKVIYSHEASKKYKDHIRFTIPLPGSSFELSPVFIISRGDPLYHYYFDICTNYIELGKKENSNQISVVEFDSTDSTEKNEKLTKFFKVDDFCQEKLMQIKEIAGSNEDQFKEKIKASLSEIAEQKGIKKLILNEEKGTPGTSELKLKFLAEITEEISRHLTDTLYVSQLIYCLEYLEEFELKQEKSDLLELSPDYDSFTRVFKRS